METPDRPLAGQRPIVKRPHQAQKERQLSQEFVMRELAEQVTAVAVTELAGFITAPDSPAWTLTLARLEKHVERILAAGHIPGT